MQKRMTRKRQNSKAGETAAHEKGTLARDGMRDTLLRVRPHRAHDDIQRSCDVDSANPGGLILLIGGAVVVESVVSSRGNKMTLEGVCVALVGFNLLAFSKQIADELCRGLGD
jgi:hypothetical protein